MFLWERKQRKLILSAYRGFIISVRRQSAPRAEITQEGSLPGIKSALPSEDKNPFSPKNSPPTETESSIRGIEDSFSAPVPTQPPASVSPENKFAPEPAGSVKRASVDRRASQDSNPFSPTSSFPPAPVGANNPFGDDSGTSFVDLREHIRAFPGGMSVRSR